MIKHEPFKSALSIDRKWLAKSATVRTGITPTAVPRVLCRHVTEDLGCSAESR